MHVYTLSSSLQVTSLSTKRNLLTTYYIISSYLFQPNLWVIKNIASTMSKL